MPTSFESERNALFASYLKETVGNLSNQNQLPSAIHRYDSYAFEIRMFGFRGIDRFSLNNNYFHYKTDRPSDWIALKVNYKQGVPENLVYFLREYDNGFTIRTKEESIFYFSSGGQCVFRHSLPELDQHNAARLLIVANDEFLSKGTIIESRKQGGENPYTIMSDNSWYEYITDLFDILHRRYPRQIPSLFEFMAEFKKNQAEQDI